MKTIILALALAAGLGAQTLPASWVGSGALYDGSAAPHYSGWASFATLVRGSQVYSYTTYTASAPKGKLTTAMQTGAAPWLRQWATPLGTLHLLAFGTAGAATSTSTSLALAGGGIAVLQLGKSPWTFEGSIRAQRAGGLRQQIYEIGFGRSF